MGAGYRGFQIQTSGGQCGAGAPPRTIQGELEQAIACVTGERARITGAGRTDAGVHALGQVANFHTESRIPADRYAPALNTALPKDIRILRSFESPPGFSARYDAISKVYRYLIVPGGGESPAARRGAAVLSGRALATRGSLSAEAMAMAGAVLVGRHDFAAFSATGSSAKTTVRTVNRLEVRTEELGALDLGLIVVEAEADGFLYKMVRIIVGALLDVGSGRTDVEAPARLLASRDRSLGPATAPPDGLYLVRVAYPEPLADLARP